MKIIYYSHTFFSDCDFPLIQELEKQGCEVYAYYHLSPWELNAGLIEISSQPPMDGVICARNIEEMKQYKDYVNLDHIFFINNPHYRWFHYQKYFLWFEVYRHMAKIKADLIQITYHLSGAENFLFKFGVPVIMTVHDPFQHSSRFTKREERERNRCFLRSQKLILLNGEMKNDFINHYHVPSNKVIVSRLGEYSHIRLFQLKTCDFTEKPFILFFGYISKYKGVEYLVDAMKILHQSYSDIELIIIGKGEYYFDISQYKNDEYIRFINRFATVKELSSLLSHCLFAVCPYIDATQSGVVQTAFSAGCPLIVTNVGNLSKAVTNNVNGLVVPPKDFMKLAEAMKILLDKPELLNSFRRNINNEWRKNMSWNGIASDYISVYKELLC